MIISNTQLMVYYQCCVLIGWANILRGYILQPTSSEKRGLFGDKKGLKSSFYLAKIFLILDIFDQLVGFY